VTAFLFNLLPLGKPRQPHPPTRLLMPCCAIGPMSPRHSPLVRLPNMSPQLRNPALGATLLGVLSNSCTVR
jgi:hypothetical protein